MSLYGWWNLVWLLAWAKFPTPGSGSHIFCCEFCCWPFAQTLEVSRGQVWKRWSKVCMEIHKSTQNDSGIFKSHGLVGNSTWPAEMHLYFWVVCRALSVSALGHGVLVVFIRDEFGTNGFSPSSPACTQSHAFLLCQFLSYAMSWSGSCPRLKITLFFIKLQQKLM